MMTEIHFNKLMALSSSLVIIMLMQLGLQLALADEVNPGLYSAKSSPYGTSFSTWTTKWWQWFIQIPNSVHPFGDNSGKYCGTNQEGPIWYLVGGKGPVVRNCDIPSGTAILFPILNTEYSFLELGNAKTELDLRNEAINENNGAILIASIDGYAIKNIDSYRVTSGLFNVTFPKDNVFGIGNIAPNTHSQAVSDGWFIMLEPLKPGPHVLHFHADQNAIPGKDTLIDVTYNLMIK
ncbi:hypothetical protein BH18THE1_BH18THE1_04620 [soil metagenome]